jgi:sec-independent protein translocase protein TatA
MLRYQKSRSEQETRMGAMSVGHWLIVMVVVAIVFGPKRLGSVGKGLGEGIKGLKDGLAGRGEDDGFTGPAAQPGHAVEGRTERP